MNEFESTRRKSSASMLGLWRVPGWELIALLRGVALAALASMHLASMYESFQWLTAEFALLLAAVRLSGLLGGFEVSWSLMPLLFAVLDPQPVRRALVRNSVCAVACGV